VDQHRFDDLTKRFSAPASRRSLLGGVIAIAAAAFGFGRDASAAATKRKPGEICRKAGECEAGSDCVPDITGRSRCSCPGGLTLCGFQCVDTTADEHNCGACGTQCTGTITGDPVDNCTLDGCCNRLIDLCNRHCCPSVDACIEATSSCCYHEQICGPDGAKICCQGTDYCVLGQCQTSGRTCATPSDCLAGETCADGDVCCTPERVCGTTCCPFMNDGCLGDQCITARPVGGLNRF
jgi:hypothetical protein